MITSARYAPSSMAIALTLSLVACSDDASAPPEPSDGGAMATDADAQVDTPDSGRTISTDRGPVVGHPQGSVTAFLGIPYAAPPVGDLRWRAPTEHDAWTAPLDASAFGAACPQGTDLLGEKTAWDEDCLTLNVWTPAPSKGASLPVMVFIHGGAFRNGASSKPLYDGGSLAALGNLVVVSMNYRLGSLGFLAHAELSAEDEHGSSGNYGLLDQQAALRWVRTNIAAFGGSPDNVTIFGESAGSMSVCTHLVSPLSAGLFRRAIGESGSCLYFATPLRAAPGTTAPSAESRGAAIARSIGCDTASDVVACLRARTAEEIVDAPYDSEGDIGFAPSMPQPNIDGYLLTESPASAFLGGRINAIDAFIGGTNQDEATLFTRSMTIATLDDYRAAVAAIAPAHVDDVLMLYPADGTSYATPNDAYDAFITDITFVCPTRTELRLLAAHGVRTYQYHFEKLTSFGRTAKLGVFHGSELFFVFGNLTDAIGMSAADRSLAASMGGMWTRFAKSGDPNDSNAFWPPRAADADVYLRINDVNTVGTGLHQANCDAISSWVP